MELNPAQLKAVNHDKGPLLIIAGAGTGKTRVITERIINLLNFNKAKSDEILALTFTEKAANEMVERVDLRLPLGYEELCIKTFHAFSENILRDAGLETGIDPGFKILSDVDQWFFFKKNLYSFELDYYRPLGNPNRFIYDLLKHFNKLKDEFISPESYLNYSKKLDGEEGDKMKEIASAYLKYQDLLMKNNYLDFGDLTYKVIELLNKRKSVLNEYQKKYKYILVDEFQDTNYAQFQLVMKLVKDHENIVVVGDDDQSIYKWRGASLSNILKFQEAFPDHKKIVLLENYRSCKNILDGAYSLIQNNNPDRLEEKASLSKKLNCNVEHNEPIEIHHFPVFTQESVFVAEKIKFLHRNENIPFQNFAILVRSNNLTHPFIDELKYLGLPYQVRNPKGLLSLEEIKDLISVIQFTANPRNDIALLRILKIDIFEISMAEILEILGKSNKENIFMYLKNEFNNGNMAIPGTESNVRKIYDLLTHLIEFSKKNSVGHLLNEFMKKSGYLKFLLENDKYEEVQNINEFANQVTKFEHENEDRSVIDFVNYLNLLEEANASLSRDEFADFESVQILTAHGAKGLEFDYVFIVDAVKSRFPTKKRRETFEIPEKLTKEIYPEGDYHLQEERRLFYVAMTRAKKKLFVTFSDRYEGNKKWKASPFVKEINESGMSIWTDHEEKEDAVEKLKKFKEPGNSIFNLPSFKGNRLSYSQIKTFKDCPLKYNYRYLMKVPIPSSHSTNFGTSIHETLKDFYQHIKDGESVDFGLLKNIYEKNWISQGYESKNHEETRKKKGLEILKNYYNKNKDPWIAPKYLERSFNVKIGNYLINGRIDRLDELKDGTFEVIDYKTGRMPKDPKLKNDLQLSIYALACRDIFKIPVSKLSIYFLEENKKVSTTRTNEQLDDLINEISKLIEEMKVSKFPAKPNFYCQFCDFRLICPAV
ncbi:AAA family ATPase [Candidatus Peregrinibacteria bacterium]|nr:AAA family ATPase [Candidatus Peregrinibacteria bacterium]